MEGQDVHSGSACMSCGLSAKLRIRITTNGSQPPDRRYGFEILAEPVEWAWPDTTAGMRQIARAPAVFLDEDLAKKEALLSWKCVTTGIPRPSPEPEENLN